MKTADLYKAVTNSIIADLEKGVAPWTKPWKTGGSVGALPTNAATGRGYHGINIPILWGATFAKGYSTHGWMTFKQAQGLGATVRTGEKSTHVVFTKQLVLKEGDSEEEKKIGMLKAYSVFNVAQIEGLPEQQLELPQLSEQQRQGNVEMFVRATRADIRIGGDRACYVPALDFIALPPLSSFKAPCNYYATALHELGHWSAHPARLNRDLKSRFDKSGDSGLFATLGQIETEGWTRDGTDWVRDVDGAAERRVPLYEAKMVHHFDHRWATYAGGSVEDEEGARDTTLTEKQNPAFEPSPRYWVPKGEVNLRAARVPSSLKRALRDANAERCLKAVVEWLTGYFATVKGRAAREDDLTRILGRNHPWRTILGAATERFLREPKTLANGADMQRETPLTTDDVAFLTDGPEDPLALTAALIDRKQPRWLMGWRDIALRSVERTVIASVFPKVGTGDTLLLKYPVVNDARLCAALNAVLSSLILDYICRQKIGGNHLKYNVFQQNAVLPPAAFTAADLALITPRVLELTYTSHAMRLWAEDLGHSGPPFAWDETRRAELRAQLDAFFARKYGLSRDELRYVLDPADAKGKEYPSETFRVLKTKEIARYGEYRTQRLVLEAFDLLARV